MPSFFVQHLPCHTAAGGCVLLCRRLCGAPRSLQLQLSIAARCTHPDNRVLQGPRP